MCKYNGNCIISMIMLVCLIIMTISAPSDPSLKPALLHVAIRLYHDIVYQYTILQYIILCPIIVQYSRLRHCMIPFGDHLLNLERYREYQHGPCARMTRTIVKSCVCFHPLSAPDNHNNNNNNNNHTNDNNNNNNNIIILAQAYLYADPVARSREAPSQRSEGSIYT